MNKYKEEREISKEEAEILLESGSWFSISESTSQNVYWNKLTGELLHVSDKWYFVELNSQPELKMFYFSPINYTKEVYVIANSESEAERFLEKEGIKAIYTFRSGT